MLRGLLWPLVGRASAAAAVAHIAYGAAAATAVLAVVVQRRMLNDYLPAWFPLATLSVLLLYGGNRAARQRQYDVGLAIDELERRFAVQRGFADWHPHAAGFLREGRLLTPIDYDGRDLGPYFDVLRPPLREFNAPAGMMIGLGDMRHVMQMTRSWQSFRHMSRLLVRFGVDRLSHSRGTRLTMGNALAARLLRSALDAKVTLWREAPMERLIIEADAVVGVVIRQRDREVQVRARRGVVLASGGFSANAQMRSRFIPFPEHHVSLVSNGNTGDGINEALAAGGQFDGDNLSNARWVVVSLLRAADGSIRKFPHLFLDRGKPGCIAVNREGKRFGNESATNLVEPMHRTGSVPAYLVCDHSFVHKYGLGFVRPGGWGLQGLIRAGYVIRLTLYLAWLIAWKSQRRR